MFKVLKTGYITDRETGENIGISYNVWQDKDFESGIWILVMEYDETLVHREKLEHILHTKDSLASSKKEKYIKRLLRTGLCHVRQQ